MQKSINLSFFLFIFYFFSSTLQGQSINGIVLDNNNKPLEFAELRLINRTDTTKIDVKYSDFDGSFEFKKLEAGNYILSCTYLGFIDFKKELSFPFSEPISIILSPSVSVLQGVTVRAKTPLIERKIDRTVMNVDAMLSNAGSNAIETLEKAPGITTDENGNIKLKGRNGVAVYVDDKPTYLSGQELENYLKSIPASGIKSIEIITNPPAKYDAAGNAGIINIITKRNKLSGLFGSINSAVQRSRFWRNNNSLNINYNTQKLGITANINQGVRKSYQDLNINRYYKNEDLSPSNAFKQNSYIVKSNNNYTGKLGLDFYANETTTFGLSYKRLENNGLNSTLNNATIIRSNQVLEKLVLADNSEDIKFSNSTINGYLKKDFNDKKSSITFDADYVLYNSYNEQDFINTIEEKIEPSLTRENNGGELPSDIKIYTFKSDYNRTLNPVTSMSFGVKTAFTNTNNEAFYFYKLADDIKLPNYDLSNEFLYKEWINAAYFNITSAVKKVNLQFGLRAEQTNLIGDQLGNKEKPASSFTRDYLQFFPTLFLSWDTDTTAFHNLSFSYGRRIDRPFFQDLNPFISPLDKFTFYTGNPNLLPTISNNLSFTHSYKGKINTTLSYSLTSDGINETLEIIDQIYYSRPANITTQQTFGLSVESGIEITKFWNLNVYSELDYFTYKSKLYDQDLNSGGPFFYISATNMFSLGKGWNAEFRGDYQSDVVVAQLKILDFGTLNLGLSKKLFKDALSIKISFNDILRSRRGSGIINNLRLTDADWNSQLDTRLVGLSLNYRFGKAKNQKQKYNAGSSESEQQRVKN